MSGLVLALNTTRRSVPVRAKCFVRVSILRAGLNICNAVSLGDYACRVTKFPSRAFVGAPPAQVFLELSPHTTPSPLVNAEIKTSKYAASARAKSLGTLRDEQPDKPKLPPMPKKALEHTEQVHPYQPLRAAPRGRHAIHDHKRGPATLTRCSTP
eukprot:scaffold123510_cov69-Phaeocystis_antarctica.AAC.2